MKPIQKMSHKALAILSRRTSETLKDLSNDLNNLIKKVDILEKSGEESGQEFRDMIESDIVVDTTFEVAKQLVSRLNRIIKKVDRDYRKEE